ncbi:MAG: HigA family addiction module antidote protein, partial [Deltaproteobacteria bacterium]|nr:HigA family addiction module antidote protein [Deltaproteobacteria bacterium]
MSSDKKSAQPPHPGYVLKKDYIDPIGVSVTDLASKLGVSRNTLSSIINERAGVSADMALRLGRAFKTNPEQWLKLKYAYELWV